MANRNRSAGHTYELDEVRVLKKYFPHIATTRSCNRMRDGEGIDICNKDESEFGRLVFDFQAKSTSGGSVPYAKLFAAMKEGGRIKVVLHRQTRKSFNKKKKQPGGKFMERGRYAVLERHGFEALLQCAVAIQHLRKTHPEAVKAVEEQMGVSLFEIPEKQLT